MYINNKYYRYLFLQSVVFSVALVWSMAMIVAMDVYTVTTSVEGFVLRQHHHHVPHQQQQCRQQHTALALALSTTTTTTTTDQSSPIAFVQNLLQQLSSSSSSSSSDHDKGQVLLNASSESWRKAIYQAIGVPIASSSSSDSSTSSTTAKNCIIAKSLQDKMSLPDSQFAILMGPSSSSSSSTTSTTTPFAFTTSFPSDIVDYNRNDDGGTVWLECQLRHVDTNQLFVIMGINLIIDNDNNNDNDSTTTATTITNETEWKILSLDWQDFREEFYPGLSGREWLRAF